MVEYMGCTYLVSISALDHVVNGYALVWELSEILILKKKRKLQKIVPRTWFKLAQISCTNTLHIRCQA